MLRANAYSAVVILSKRDTDASRLCVTVMYSLVNIASNNNIGAALDMLDRGRGEALGLYYLLHAAV